MTKQFFLNLDNIKIHCQSAGTPGNPAIVFLHGASLSSEFLEKQFKDESLSEKFFLYAFDLPGHGQSGKAEDTSAYTLKGLGKILSKIIRALELKNYIVVTISIGSNILAETIHELKGCKGIFLAGACLIGEKFPVSSFIKDFPYMYLLTASTATSRELEDYAQYDMYQPASEVVQKFISIYQSTDPAFRNTIGNVLSESDYSDEIECLKEAGIPVALVYGKEEAIIKPHYLEDAGLPLWKNKIHLIEDSGHLVNIDNPSGFNQLLFEFASEAIQINKKY